MNENEDEGNTWGLLELQQRKEIFQSDSGDLAAVPVVIYLKTRFHVIGRNETLPKKSRVGTGYSCIPLNNIRYGAVGGWRWVAGRVSNELFWIR